MLSISTLDITPEFSMIVSTSDDGGGMVAFVHHASMHRVMMMRGCLSSIDIVYR